MEGAPYRGGPGERASSAPEETGLVADLIEQFADPLAFYRELVQNAIDAGTDSISVRVAWGDDGAAISVRDAGSGMSREIIEEELLVLFRSGKEGRDDAIGKFGVGFVSVLSMSPEVVEVHTSRGAGMGHVVHLRSDQSWDLFEVEGGSASGTTVTLRVPIAHDAYGQLVVDSEVALKRWCRHARVPIHYVALDQSGELLHESRVDRPLDLEGALVSVEVQAGDTHAIVGLLPAKETHCGFYNGGLTLWETSSPLVGAVSFKVQDPHLEHTLSRDNVRRDAAFKRAMRLVQTTIQRDLSTAVIDALAEAAAADVDRYRGLLTVVDPAVIAAPAGRWTFPIIEPIDGRSVATADVAGLVATYSSPLVRTLAGRGVPVLNAIGLDESEIDALLDLVSSVTGRRRCRDAHTVYTFADRDSPGDNDEALLSLLSDILEDVVRAPSAVHFARLDGVAFNRFCVAGSAGDGPWLLTDEIDDDPLRLLARPPLILNSRDPLVAAARVAMDVEPELAATFLARGVLLSTGRLDKKRDEALTRSALERLLGSRT